MKQIKSRAKVKDLAIMEAKNFNYQEVRPFGKAVISLAYFNFS